jgi:PhnB protein
MSDNAPKNQQTLTPYLLYEDVAGALSRLSRVFGLREREVETMKNPEGNVVHAAMEIGGGSIMLGCPSEDYKASKRLGQSTQNLYVYVQDVDQHFKNSKAAGATILSEIEDTFYGDRRYGVEDLEGHQWYFAKTVRVTKPEAWKPTDEDLSGHG